MSHTNFQHRKTLAVGCLEVLEPFANPGAAKNYPYCTALCRAVDVPAAGTESILPPPPASARGLLGALTERPGDPTDAAVAALKGASPLPGDEPVLPTNSEKRKQIPIFSGVLNYFPLAIAAVARWSKRGNDKHNPGQPLHWSRDKSTDHEDCIARHLIDIDTPDPRTGEYEDAMALAWRALAKLQLLEEQRLGKPMSRASKLHIRAAAEPADSSCPPTPEPDYCGAV